MAAVVLNRPTVRKRLPPERLGNRLKTSFVAYVAHLYFLAIEKMIASVVGSKIPENLSGTYRA